MNYRKIVIILFVLSLAGAVAGVILFEPQNIGLCEPDERFSCINPISDNVGQPLGLGLAPVAFTLLILLFTKEHVYRAWKHFAVWYIPLAAILVIITPVYCGAALGLCFDKELVIWGVSGLYLAISLILIIYKSFKLPATNAIKRSKL